MASIPAGLGWLLFGGVSAAGQSVIVPTCTLLTASSVDTSTEIARCFVTAAEDIGSVEGKAFSGQEVARFLDSTLASSDAGYTATITWGDATSSAGTVEIVHDSINHVTAGIVKGSHTYAEEGSRDLTVRVSHGTPHADDTATATTDDAPIHVTASGSATEGASSDALVAVFTDENPNALASDFSADVNCDFVITRPNISSASLTEQAAPTIVKNGDHFEVHFCRYTEEGVYPNAVTVTDKDGKATETQFANVHVANAGLTVTQTFNQTTTEFGLIDGETLAKFTDANGTPDAKDFSATVDWGDNSGTDTGTSIGGNKTDGFAVTGSHSYEEGGTYTATVTITDNKLGAGDQKSTTTGTLTATVTDKALHASVKTATTTESTSTGMVVIATFTDSNNDDVLASNYSATIDWKDGSGLTTCPSTTCTISSNSENENFEIKSSHTYAEENTGYKPHVTITDKGGATDSADATVKVNDAALTPYNGAAISAQQNQSTGNVVTATFTDASANKDKADFTATIDWGDGKTSAGTVSVADNGTFSVTGSHTYATHGSLTVKTSIYDTGGNSVSATAAATVAQPPTLAQTGAGWLIPPGASGWVFVAGLLLVLGVLGWWAVLRDRFVWSSRRLR